MKRKMATVLVYFPKSANLEFKVYFTLAQSFFAGGFWEDKKVESWLTVVGKCFVAGLAAPMGELFVDDPRQLPDVPDVSAEGVSLNSSSCVEDDGGQSTIPEGAVTGEVMPDNLSTSVLSSSGLRSSFEFF